MGFSAVTFQTMCLMFFVILAPGSAEWKCRFRQQFSYSPSSTIPSSGSKNPFHKSKTTSYRSTTPGPSLESTPDSREDTFNYRIALEDSSIDRRPYQFPDAKETAVAGLRSSRSRRHLGWPQRQGFLVPGYRYLGPGNPMNNGAPINRVDAAARQHDYRYTQAMDRFKQTGNSDAAFRNVQHADNDFIHSLRGIRPSSFREAYGRYLGRTKIGMKRAIESGLGFTLYPRFSK